LSDAERDPDDHPTAEAFESLYHALPADRQAALRDEAVASLVQKGYHRDYLTMLILPEVCHLLAAQVGGSVAPVPPASSVRPPTRSMLPPTRASGEHRHKEGKPQARLRAPTRRHLLREDLEETGRLLSVYPQAIARGEIGRSEADRLKFVSAAKHALRCGEDPPALFADNLQQQRWYYDQADEDTARKDLKAYLYGIDAQRRPQPPPAIEMPDLSDDARIVDAVQRQWARLGHRGDAWAYVHVHDPTWSRERWDKAVHELAQHQLAWKEAHALSPIGELGIDTDWRASPFPADPECAECGEVSPTCMCQAVEDNADA
jgi:hypothetical protein